MSAMKSHGGTVAAGRDVLLAAAISKCRKRLIPFMFLLYFVAFIDRVNVGFAKDAMAADLHMSNDAYALGAGIFFAAYAMVGVPANLLMNRIGAKLWLSGTTILWGIVSACTGLVESPTQFILLRFALGVAEAGSDTEAGAPTPETRNDAPLAGQITVSVDIEDEAKIVQVRSAFAEFDADAVAES